jgi:hypothetical protein
MECAISQARLRYQQGDDLYGFALGQLVVNNFVGSFATNNAFIGPMKSLGLDEWESEGRSEVERDHPRTRGEFGRFLGGLGECEEICEMRWRLGGPQSLDADSARTSLGGLEEPHHPTCRCSRGQTSGSGHASGAG